MRGSILYSLLGAASVRAVTTPTPVKASELLCRGGPSTDDVYVLSFYEGDDIKMSCQVKGESIYGNDLWDLTYEGCFVSDYYVYTGTNDMVAPECTEVPEDELPDSSKDDPDDGGDDDDDSSGGSDTVTVSAPLDSKQGGSITRSEIIKRGKVWTGQHLSYSMSGYADDGQGTSYRTDCSGFVSMAFHATQSYSTVTLPSIVTSIDWSDLQEGDIVGTLGSGTGGSDGHVVMFTSWIDDTHFNTLECAGTIGCVAYSRSTTYRSGFAPYRYNEVAEEETAAV